MNDLRSLEGRQIGLALTDGSRIDDATLVSARTTTGTLWLCEGGVDVFVPTVAVLEVWKLVSQRPRAA